MPKEKYYTSKTRRIIKLAKEKVDKYPWLFNEATVEREIIDPLLEALGWKFPNVRREVRLNGIKPQSFSKHPVTSDWVENEEIKILQNGNTLSYRRFILSFWDEIMNLQNEGLFDGTKVSKGSGAQKDIPKKSREKLENNKWSRKVYGEKRRIFLKQVLYGLNKKGKALDVEVKP